MSNLIERSISYAKKSAVPAVALASIATSSGVVEARNQSLPSADVETPHTLFIETPSSFLSPDVNFQEPITEPIDPSGTETPYSIFPEDQLEISGVATDVLVNIQIEIPGLNSNMPYIVRANRDSFMNENIELFNFTSESGEVMQRLVNIILLEQTSPFMNVLSYDEFAVDNSEGRPNENGFLDGEMFSTIDLRNGIEIILVADSDIPQLVSFDYPREMGFYIDKNAAAQGKLVLYFNPVRLYDDYYTLEQQQEYFPYRALLMPLSWIRKFQTLNINGQAETYMDLSQAFSALRNSAVNPWRSLTRNKELLDAVKQQYGELVPTLVPMI